MWTAILDARNRYGYAQMRYGWDSPEAKAAREGLIAQLHAYTERLVNVVGSI